MRYMGYLMLWVVTISTKKKRFWEFSIFELLRRTASTGCEAAQAANGNFRALKPGGGGAWRGYMGPAATAWDPVGARVPILTPNDDANPLNDFGNIQIFESFEVPLNEPTQSPHPPKPKPHKGGGGSETTFRLKI